MPELPDLAVSVTWRDFDPVLVALSVAVSVLGSWCGLLCAGRGKRATGAATALWLVAAALAIGGGAIWSMHFIGMLAFQSHVPYNLDVVRTLLSLVAAVVASAVGLGIARTLDNVVGYVLGGVVTGLGVAGMHYLGMSAMQVNGELDYRPAVVGVSLAVAVVASSLALCFALTVASAKGITIAAVVMGIGICTMHYVGMLALLVVPHLDARVARGGTDPFALAMPIFGVSSVLLLVLLSAGLFDDGTDGRTDGAPTDEHGYGDAPRSPLA